MQKEDKIDDTDKVSLSYSCRCLLQLSLCADVDMKNVLAAQSLRVCLSTLQSTSRELQSTKTIQTIGESWRSLYANIVNLITAYSAESGRRKK